MKLASHPVEPVDSVVSDVCVIAENLLRIPVISTRRIDGSGNNRVYSVQCSDSKKYVAKFYFRHSSDQRERLEVEFASLSFLWRQGISDIPYPLAISREKSCAIYGFIEGKKITPAEITVDDINRVVDFLRRLKDLSGVAQAQNIPPASEACFSIKAIIASIEERLNRLTSLKGQGEEYRKLEAFLRDDFKPFLTVLKRWAQRQCNLRNISFDLEIPRRETTLSPSDFGFHNAIRANDGRVVFLDFEYFGWDDPAKTISDFLFHPAVILSQSMKEIFVQRMFDIFKENGRLAERIKIAYPLFGLKWCMIMLNEFVTSGFIRRVYATENLLDRNQMQREQLDKAKNFYCKIKESYTEFPYAK